MASYYKVIAENRAARHDYNILETYKAGLVLTGSEVKSIRLGRVNLRDSFGRAEGGELWLYQMHISPYEKEARYRVDPTRKRKLLLEKRELERLIGKVSQKGLTLVPLKLYFEGDWAKVELGLGKSKKVYEKRKAIKEKETKREIERALKERSK